MKTLSCIVHCLGKLVYYIGGVKTFWQQLQFESDFRDVTLVCDDGHNQAHKLIISSYSPFLKILKKL